MMAALVLAATRSVAVRALYLIPVSALVVSVVVVFIASARERMRDILREHDDHRS